MIKEYKQHAVNGHEPAFVRSGRMFRGFFVKTVSFVGYTVQYGCIAHCAFEYIGEFVSCSGPSMEPTITNHNVVFSERVSRHLCRIQKGDIVIAKSPFDPKMNICKRVIGLEGDKVCTSGPSDIFKTHTYVPRGHVWLEGDNLRNSTDSRSYGPIPYALIRGRVCLKLWPPHSFGVLAESPNDGRIL
ncbi:mitochondrial inner membrane protease subunit 1 isoform X1 [Rhinichthys klamathensis goyatoka]|uniref:mitochondrial inner membrane protease subunit 1 isoform X1 n=1 Tax=Rhinichthys klamathensis goyatoka TaxID=3034132 RepID=UPI0024B48578|nr:mitochondrial inner membrane protease subunit 1 isoform X1 [Rhinichthys klamathensis goyatoka]